MKRLLKASGLSLLIFFGSYLSAEAVSTFIVQQGGTGANTFTGGLIAGNATNPLYGGNATTTVSCSGSTTCTQFIALGGSPITISSTAGSGTVATSSSETNTQIPFWTSTNGTPALLSGGSSNLTWDGVKFFTSNASTTLATIGSLWVTGFTAGAPYFDSTGKLFNDATTSTSVASQDVWRDANGNAFFNNYLANGTKTTSAGGTTFLTASSSRFQALTGSSNQTYQLPDATTLSLGPWFSFNNNSSGSLIVTNAGASTQYTVPAGGVTQCGPTDISSANGVWDCHSYIPSTVTWGTGVTGLIFNTALTTTPQILSGASSATSPSFIPQRGANTTGFGGDGSGLFLTTGGTAKLTVLSGGNVGVGTTSPYKTLSIGGDTVIGAAAAGGTLGDIYVPKYASAAGAFAAFDPTGRIISTSSPSSSSSGGAVNYQEFTASGTWTKPAGATASSTIVVEAWGGGGSGAGVSASGCGSGGGGGSMVQAQFIASKLGSTETVTVAATTTGGTGGGSAGGNTTFGSWLTAYGGGGGGSNGGGGGGGGNTTAGATAADTSSSSFGAGGGVLGGTTSGTASNFGGGAGGKDTASAGNNGGDTVYGGGGGGGCGTGSGVSGLSGGLSIYGGGGGGGGSFNASGGTLGASTFGGSGGAGTSGGSTGNSGSVPGGGGGGAGRSNAGSATGGSGARGEVRVWTFL